MTSDRKPLTSADEDILMEAARWLGRAREGMSASEKRDFRAWLDARREHVAAADAVASAWAGAPKAARQAGLVPPQRGARRPVINWRDWLSWLTPSPRLVAACVVPLLIVGTWWFANVRQLDYTTGARQRIALSLPDGSRVWLAPRSHLSARFDPLGRRVQLHEGEASFQVAHRDRSFEVTAGDVKVVDLGTLFDVRKREADKVSIVLVEGRIEVRDRATGRTLAVPAPGESVSVDGGVVTVLRTDAQAAIAWRDGRLVFNAVSLPVALARFAEQGAPPVALRDDALGRIRISGAFATSDIQSFLSALSDLHPVAWRRTPEGYELRQR